MSDHVRSRARRPGSRRPLLRPRRHTRRRRDEIARPHDDSSICSVLNWVAAPSSQVDLPPRACRINLDESAPRSTIERTAGTRSGSRPLIEGSGMRSCNSRLASGSSCRRRQWLSRSSPQSFAPRKHAPGNAVRRLCRVDSAFVIEVAHRREADVQGLIAASTPSMAIGIVFHRME